MAVTYPPTTFTIPTTAVYRTPDGSQALQLNAGQIISYSMAVQFGIAAAVPTPSSSVWDYIDDRATPNPKAYTLFTGKANGTPVAADSGQAWSIVGTDPLEVISGKLTNDGVSGAQAGYANLDLNAIVTHIGATFTMGAYTTANGAATLVVWTSPTNGTVHPNSPFHLVIGVNTMTLGYWDTGVGLGTISGGTATFGSPLIADGVTQYTVDGYIYGDRAYVSLSNGATLNVQNSKIATNAGDTACWEVYQLNAATDAKAAFVDTWADTNPVSATIGRSRELTRFDIYNAVPKVVVKEYAPTGNTPLTILTTSTPFDTSLGIAMNYPPSGRIEVEVVAFITVVGAANVLFQINASAVSVTTAAISGTVIAKKVMSGTPGAAVTFAFAALRIGGTSAVISQYGPGGNNVVTKATAL